MGCCYSADRPDVSFNTAWRATLPDLSGKTIAITGCTSGTGYVAAMECRARGARVILLNRPSGRAQAALIAVANEADGGTADSGKDWRASVVGKSAGNRKTNGPNSLMQVPDPQKVVHVDCDLQDLESVRAAAATVIAAVGDSGLDVLAFNAGITNGKGNTKDGYDPVIQTNHISHMLLLCLLYDSLEAAAAQRGEARVVFHSSMARIAMGLPQLCKKGVKKFPACAFAKAPRSWPADLEGGMSGEGVLGTYGLSKAANLVAFSALHEKLAAKGSAVKSLIAHPGTAATGIFAKQWGKCFMCCLGNMMVAASSHSDADGACPLLTCIANSAAQSGEFYAPKGSDPMMKYESQTKGPCEKVVWTDWEQEMMEKNRENVWNDTYTGLGVQFDIA